MFSWRYRKNFVGAKNEFELAMVNEPSVLELSRFDCTYFYKLKCNRLQKFWVRWIPRN